MSSVQVFISYAHEDVDNARRLYRDLRNAGLNPWLDEESLSPGQRWEPEIKEAIKNSRYFIPLLSRNSVMKRGFVQREIKDALDIVDEVRKSDIFIVPVRLDKIEITDRKLRHIHFVDLFPDWNHGVDNILRTIKSGASPLSPATKRGMRAAQIGLGIIVVIGALSILLQANFSDSLIIILSIALLIIGIERIISGIFSPGKGRRAILAFGILDLIVSIIFMAFPLTSSDLGIVAIAPLADGTARLYFGIANKTTSRRSRIFSMVTGIMETISFIIILVGVRVHGGLFLLLVLGITLMIVGIQMMAAGIAGRRLTIAR